MNATEHELRCPGCQWIDTYRGLKKYCPRCAGKFHYVAEFTEVRQRTKVVTKLTRPVVRETSEVDQRTRQPFVVALEGRLVRIRPKRAKEWFTVTIRQLWLLAATNKAAENRQKKLEARTATRKERSK